MGLILGNVEAGKIASIGALVILYMQPLALVNRMMNLMICGFIMIFSYASGVIFSNFGAFTPLILGLFIFFLHYVLNRMKLVQGPGNFFFILAASVGISTTQTFDKMIASIGSLTIGVLIACTLGMIYSLLIIGKSSQQSVHITPTNRHTPLKESLIFGLFGSLAMAIALYFKFENAYWIPASALAVMQGMNTKHTWTRAGQRIIGTFVGLSLTYVVLQLPITPLGICFAILMLQSIVEFFIVRNYAIAAIFITMLTIFLAEPNMILMEDSLALIKTRFLNIVIGSSIGALGGYILFRR